MINFILRWFSGGRTGGTTATSDAVSFSGSFGYARSRGNYPNATLLTPAGDHVAWIDERDVDATLVTDFVAYDSRLDTEVWSAPTESVATVDLRDADIWLNVADSDANLDLRWIDAWNAPVYVTAEHDQREVGAWADEEFTTLPPMPVAAMPVADPAPGSYISTQVVSFSTTTPGASMRYSTNGIIPDATHGIIYTGPITITDDTTFKIVAYAPGYTVSQVLTAAYVIENVLVTENPVFNPDGGCSGFDMIVLLTCATPGATIRYTDDGSTPTSSYGTIYVDFINVTFSQTINAIAYAAGYDDSAVVSAYFSINGAISQPYFTPSGGEYAEGQSVTITCDTVGASIYYTTDGSEPDEFTGIFYDGTPISVAASETLKAIAYATCYITSSVVTEVYVINGAVADPTFSPVGGNYDYDITVTISCATPGATIRYTVDDTPTSSFGAIYTGPFIFDVQGTLRAIAYKANYLDSGVAEVTYTKTAATPVITPASGNVDGPFLVTITSATPGATIYYSLDGTDPRVSNGITYTGPFMLDGEGAVTATAYAVGYAYSALAYEAYSMPNALAWIITDNRALTVLRPPDYRIVAPPVTIS